MILLLAAAAAVEAGRMFRDARRARRINRAMHELRRPLQAIALSLESSTPDVGGAEACLLQARGALRDLDAVVNGRIAASSTSTTPVGAVLDALDRRWRFADVAVEGCGIDIAVDADPSRLGAALDNLVANALRHGSGIVRVRAAPALGRIRFEVRDGGPAPAPLRLAGSGRDPRHGHGLHVVADVAADHGGTVAPARPATEGGTLAAISLPLARDPIGA